MDDMTTRQVPGTSSTGWCRTISINYWQLSLRFLKIAREAWPALRAERGAIEAAERRDLLIEAEAKRLAGTRRAGDRRRLDRLDAGDRETARHHRARCRTAPWCCPASTRISTTHPGS